MKKTIKDERGRVVLEIERIDGKYYMSYSYLPYFTCYRAPVEGNSMQEAEENAKKRCLQGYESFCETFEEELRVCQRAKIALGKPDSTTPRKNEFFAAI